MVLTKLPLVALVLLGFGTSVYGRELPTAAGSPRYPAIRTQFNQSLSGAVTTEQRLELYRQTVAQGRYSGRPMLVRMLGNFEEGSFHLDLATRGLPTTVRLLASDNRNVVVGSVRTLVYAKSLQADGRFQVTGLNQVRRNPVGKTDADIVFRHQPTGLQGRMEVKNMTPISQRADLKRLRGQILKMAADAQATGEVQIWANRQDVLPKLRDFAEQHGVLVAERLRTGSKNVLAEDLRFPVFADALDQRLRAQARLVALSGSIQLGTGTNLAYQAIRQLEADVRGFGNTAGDWLRIGEHGSTLLTGSGLTAAGAAEICRRIPALANSSRLATAARWGGPVAIAGTVSTEGFLVSQYVGGTLTERQFWFSQANLGGGLVGGAAGSYVGLKTGALTGAAVGSFLGGPPGAGVGAGIGGTLGAVVGGFGGGYAGAYYASFGVERLYELHDNKQREQFTQFLARHYQSN